MATITDKTVNNMAATEPIADEKASASGRLITITIIMLIGLFIIYIYLYMILYNQMLLMHL